MKTSCFLFVVLLMVPGICLSRLSLEDNPTLTRNLQALSTDWVQEAVDAANQILWKAEYTRDDWQPFFSEGDQETPAA